MNIPAPDPLNGDLLLAELLAAGVPATAVLLIGGEVVIECPPGYESQVADVVTSHAASASAAEGEASAARANETTIRDRAAQALATNADFLALTSPTNAQSAAQVKALTRQVNGLIRLVLGRLDGTE